MNGVSWFIWMKCVCGCVANECAVIPFGRVSALKPDLAEAGREGVRLGSFGNGVREQVKTYL